MKITLEVLRCANHPRNFCLAIADRRITAFKCCGNWRTVVKWWLTPAELRAEVKKALYRQR